MTCDDERPPLVVVLEIVVECGSNVVVTLAGNGCVNVSRLFVHLTRIAQARLAVIGYKHVGGVLIHACVCIIFEHHALQHLFVVECGIVGSSLHETFHNVFCCIDVERVNILGDFRNLVPIGLPRVIDLFLHKFCCF